MPTNHPNQSNEIHFDSCHSFDSLASRRCPADRGPTARGPTARCPADRCPTDRGPTARGPTAHGLDVRCCRRVGPAGRKSRYVVFGDLTNKKTTFGGGRFIYIPVPDSLGNAVIDFNKAYNPPCVFSPYATCPLPTENNTLAFEVTAGEKMWGEMHH